GLPAIGIGLAVVKLDASDIGQTGIGAADLGPVSDTFELRRADGVSRSPRDAKCDAGKRRLTRRLRAHLDFPLAGSGGGDLGIVNTPRADREVRYLWLIIARVELPPSVV